MSGKALSDLNTLSLNDSEKNHENSNKVSFGKPCTENASENVNNVLNRAPSSLDSTPSKAVDGSTNGVDVANNEVEYIDSENLEDLESVEPILNTLLTRLSSKDWVLVCEALNNVRQISIYHKEQLLDKLGDVLLLIVKSLKSPRSAVCKTAIMTSTDIFKAYNDSIIDSLDPLLLQLFLKASQDKRFVCEAAEKALIAMTTFVSSSMLLPKVQPYLKHKNPRIRAKASMCFCRSVPLLGLDGIKSYGIDKLIQIAASQLSDQLPDSREAARSLALELQTAYEKSLAAPIEETEQPVTKDSWEDFCQSKLSPLNAQAILRVTSVAKEGLVMGC